MLNRVQLIGNLGADPELRDAGSTKVCEMRVATAESWTDKGGNKQENTEWHRIIVWGRMGENCAKYLEKGRQVYVEGRIQTRDWTDKEGTKRYTTEIVAKEVKFLGGGRNTGGGPARSSGGGSGGSGDYRRDDSGPAPAPAPAREDFGDDDIPF